MCSRIECSTCRKPTWTGCGRHIEQALAGVPKKQRCTCREQAKLAPAAPAKKGLLSWLGFK